MIDPNARKIVLKACARCHGDLLFDSYEEDFACMQCGRHFNTSAVLAAQPMAETAKAEAPVAAMAA